MGTRRSSRTERDEGRGRRSRRRAKSPDWTTAIIAISTIGVLLVVVFIMADKFRTAESDPSPSTQPRDKQPAKTGDKTESDPRPVAPHRPAPDVDGELIKAADAIFRDAKRRFAEAEDAAERGEAKESEALMAACRDRFAALDALLLPYQSWLAEAKQKNWETPRAYGTIERRSAKYDLFRKRVPPK